MFLTCWWRFQASRQGCLTAIKRRLTVPWIPLRHLWLPTCIVYKWRIRSAAPSWGCHSGMWMITGWRIRSRKDRLYKQGKHKHQLYHGTHEGQQAGLPDLWQPRHINLWESHAHYHQPLQYKLEVIWALHHRAENIPIKKEDRHLRTAQSYPKVRTFRTVFPPMGFSPFNSNLS